MNLIFNTQYFCRTKVFSGNKTTFYTEVPSLVNCCIQTIKENLDGKYFHNFMFVRPYIFNFKLLKLIVSIDYVIVMNNCNHHICVLLL